jgi:glutamine amidotransferase
VTIAGSPRIAVLDYGIGNLRSAQKALEHVGAHAELTDDPGFIRDADAVVLPGVGAFGACMSALARSGLGDLAIEAAASGRPFLGICVGMQLLYTASEESPGVGGLAGEVKRPQMQWNRLVVNTPGPLLEGLEHDAWVYFVHSYAADDPTHTVASCDYGGAVTAVVRRDNVWATQFHPEKSGRDGLRLLANFVAMVAPRVPSEAAR